MLGPVDVLRWTADPLPELRAPIPVAAFEGLFDVGEAATGAVAALRGTDAIEVAEIDPDPLFRLHRAAARRAHRR